MIISLFLKALITTLGIVSITVSLGYLIGTVISFIRVTYQYSGKMKVLNRLIMGYVYLFRGTPLALQLMILIHLMEHTHSEWLVTIIGVGLNSGAYVSEIIRGYVLAVDYNQVEAAQILGFSHAQALKLVIFPQALKNAIPSLLNEFCALVKETAVISVTVKLVDLTGVADNLREVTKSNWPYYVSGAIYLIVVVVVTWSVKRLIKWLDEREIEKEHEAYVRDILWTQEPIEHKQLNLLPIPIPIPLVFVNVEVPSAKLRYAEKRIRVKLISKVQGARPVNVPCSLGLE